MWLRSLHRGSGLPRPNRPKPVVEDPEPDDIADATRVIEKSKPMCDLVRLALETFFERHCHDCHSSPASAGDAESLAPREQQVLELLVTGYSYKDVSKELAISTSTVGTYVQRIYEKLHVSSRREIMERSGKNG